MQSKQELEEKMLRFMAQCAFCRAQIAIETAIEAYYDLIVDRAIADLVIELKSIGVVKPLSVLRNRVERPDVYFSSPEQKAAVTKSIDELYRLFSEVGSPDQEKSGKAKELLGKKGFKL